MDDEDILRRGDTFAITIDYEAGTDAPSRVFRAMADMVAAVERADRVLIQAFASDITPVLLLEDIERGSVRGWFRNALRDLPDSALEAGEVKRVVGHYLVRAKRAVINWADRHTTIEGRADVIDLQEEVRAIAEETKLLPIPAYAAPSVTDLVETARDFQQAAVQLREGEAIHYESADGSIAISKSFNIAPEQLEALVTKETYSNRANMILRVKKPDFLGNSQWEFRHGTRAILATIEDREWLDRFHSRDSQTVIMPGDAVESLVRIEVSYGFDAEVVSERYVIEEVTGIIRPQPQQPLSLQEKT